MLSLYNRVPPESFYGLTFMAGVPSIILAGPLALAFIALLGARLSGEMKQRVYWILSSPAIAFQSIYLSSSLLPFIAFGVVMGNLVAAVFWTATYWALFRVAPISPVDWGSSDE